MANQEIKLFGVVNVPCTTATDKQIKRDFRTIKSRCSKYTTKIAFGGHIFIASLPDRWSYDRFTNKIDDLFNRDKIRCTLAFGNADILSVTEAECISVSKDFIVEDILNTEPIECEWDKERQPTEQEYRDMFSSTGIPEQYYEIFKKIFDENNDYTWTL